MNISPKDNARAIVDKFYKLQVKNRKNPNWKDAIEQADILCESLISALPMYTGNLNPKWKFWKETKEQLKNL